MNEDIELDENLNVRRIDDSLVEAMVSSLTFPRSERKGRIFYQLLNVSIE
jgi:hypothetical protein